MVQAKHVAVLMGGWSAEREVSLASGNACAEALEAEGFRVTRVDVGRDIAQVLIDLRPEVALNVLHGPYGEDGCIQGLLELLDIPYTHSGVLASALAMNKALARDVFKGAGIPIADGKVVARLEAARAHAMKPPYVIKPVAEGSSVGVFIVGEDMRHPPQELYAPDWPFGEEVLVERGLQREGVRVERIREIMGGPEYEIVIDLGLGRGEDRVFTCDLSEEYVRLNGKYTT
jgi:D-alanine-D-alanine ligase